MQLTTVGGLVDGNIGEIILAGVSPDPRKSLRGRLLILTEAAFKRPPLLHQGQPTEVPYGTQLVVTDVIQPLGAQPTLIVAVLMDGPHLTSDKQFELPRSTHIIA